MSGLEEENDSENESAQYSSVVYIGRLPFGFEQPQMETFFKQFGDIKNIRMSVNKKTGKSKHYAFIEFESPDVAKVVADTMDGYILMNHTIKAAVLPKEKVFIGLFKGANKKYHKIPWKKIDINRRKRPNYKEVSKDREARLLKRDEKRRKQFEKLGIKFTFEGYKNSKIIKAEKEVSKPKKAEETKNIKSTEMKSKEEKKNKEKKGKNVKKVEKESKEKKEIVKEDVKTKKIKEPKDKVSKETKKQKNLKQNKK